MLHRSVIPAMGLTRIVIGVALVIDPSALGRALGVADPQRSAPLGRLLAARELAIGIGTLLAWRRGRDEELWLTAQAISDGSDTIAFAAATLAGRVPPGRGWAMAAFAASGVIGESWAALVHARGARPSPRGHRS